MGGVASRTIVAIGWILAAALLAWGCGDSGSASGTTAGSQAAGATSESTPTVGKTAEPAPKKPAKPKNPAPTLTKGDCNRLSRLLTRLGPEVEETTGSVSARISNCTLYIETGFVSISLDAEPPIRERFLSGVRSNPQRRPVSGLGEPREGKPGAYWVPDLHRVFVWRQGGWFTLFMPYRMREAEAHRDALRLARLALALRLR